MAASRYMAAFLILSFITECNSQPIIQIYQKTPRSVPSDSTSSDDDMYCSSWRFSVEKNDAGKWSGVPKRCLDYVKEYMTEDGFRSDSEIVANNSLEFAKTVKMASNGKDAWVFDIDETLISNLPYYASHGYGSNTFDEVSFNEWVGLGEAPALPASLRLYKELEEMGITIFLLTGREEHQRNVTEKNLRNAGYTNWEKLLLRRPSDKGKPASTYKSEKRKEIEDEGYTIHGCSGDQWSDLLGFSVGIRSFKLPNPMYYIP